MNFIVKLVFSLLPLKLLFGMNQRESWSSQKQICLYEVYQIWIAFGQSFKLFFVRLLRISSINSKTTKSFSNWNCMRILFQLIFIIWSKSNQKKNHWNLNLLHILTTWNDISWFLILMSYELKASDVPVQRAHMKCEISAIFITNLYAITCFWDGYGISWSVSDSNDDEQENLRGKKHYIQSILSWDSQMNVLTNFQSIFELCKLFNVLYQPIYGFYSRSRDCFLINSSVIWYRIITKYGSDKNRNSININESCKAHNPTTWKRILIHSLINECHVFCRTTKITSQGSNGYKYRWSVNILKSRLFWSFHNSKKVHRFLYRFDTLYSDRFFSETFEIFRWLILALINDFLIYLRLFFFSCMNRLPLYFAWFGQWKTFFSTLMYIQKTKWFQ